MFSPDDAVVADDGGADAAGNIIEGFIEAMVRGVSVKICDYGYRRRDDGSWRAPDRHGDLRI